MLGLVCFTVSTVIDCFPVSPVRFWTRTCSRFDSFADQCFDAKSADIKKYQTRQAKDSKFLLFRKGAGTNLRCH